MMERALYFAAINKRMAAAIILSAGLHFAGLNELRLPFGRVVPPPPLNVTIEGVESLLLPQREEAQLSGPTLEIGQRLEPVEPFMPSFPSIPSPPPSPPKFGFPPPLPHPPDITGIKTGLLPQEERPPVKPRKEWPEMEEPICEFEATIRPDEIEPPKPFEEGVKPPEGIEPPELLLTLMPPYPKEVVEKELQGQVVVDILVGEDGEPLRANVRGERRLEPLANLVLEAVRNWRFKPARKKGKVVKAVVRVKFTFSLGREGAPPGEVEAVAPPKEGEKPKIEGKEIEVAAEFVGTVTPSLIRPLVEVKLPSPPKERAEEAKIIPPRLLFPLMPPYPKDALEAGEEGEVVLYLLVDEIGEPKRVAVEATGVPVSLIRATLEAVSTWGFKPAKKEGQPFEAWVKIRLKFSREAEEGAEGRKEPVSAETEASQEPQSSPQEGGEATRPLGPLPRPGGEAGAGGEGGPQG